MPANTAPIFSGTPDVQFGGYMVTGSSGADLTTGTNYLLFTAGANGSFVSKVRLRCTPAGASSATVFRLWINNGLTTATAANSNLYDEITLPVTTPSTTAATPSYEMPLNFALPAGYKLYGTIGASSANGWTATVVGGDY